MLILYYAIEKYVLGRAGAVGGHHLEAELPQEVQEGLLLASVGHPQTPGIHRTDAQAPLVEGKPPLANPVQHPKKQYKNINAIWVRDRYK
jgi:hypothetical protein